MKPIKHIGLIVACTVSAALFFPLLANQGPPVGVDLPAWTAIGHLLATEVVADQHWFIGVILPAINAGQTVGSTYSLNLMILWLLNLVTSPDIAAKLPCVLTAVIVASGVHRIAQRFVNPMIAGCGSVLAVLVSGELILKGMWYDVLSIGIAFHLWSTLQATVPPWTGVRWLVATLLLAAAMYAHPIGAIAATIIWASTVLDLLLHGRVQSKAQTAILVAAVFPCALMLAAPQIAGLLSNTQGGAAPAHVAWRIGLQRLFRIGDLSWNHGRASLAMIAVLTAGIIVYSADIKRLPKDFLFAIIGLALACAFIMVQRPVVALVNCCHVPFLSSLALYAERFSYLWGLLIILLFFILLGRRLSSLLPDAQWGQSGRFVAHALFASTLVLALYVGKGLLASPFQLTLGTIRERTELLAVWSWLHAHATDLRSRVCMEPTDDSYTISGDGIWTGVTTNLTHVLDLTPLYAPGVQRIGGSMFGSRFNKHYHLEKPITFLGVDAAAGTDSIPQVGERMQQLRCGYALAHSDSVRALLSRVPSLQIDFESGGFTIFRNERSVESSDSGLHLVPTGSNRYRLDYSGEASASVVVPLAYSDQWAARLSGVPIQIDETQGLLRLHVPAGLQSREGELRYGSDRIRNLSLLILVVGMVISLMIGVLCARISRTLP